MRDNYENKTSFEPTRTRKSKSKTSKWEDGGYVSEGRKRRNKNHRDEK